MALKASIASDIMTENVESVREDDSLQTAAERLAQHDVGALPVCDERNHLKGIITDRDIVVGAVARGKDPAKTTVGEVETRSPITVGPDEPVERVTEIMAQNQIRRLPVVENGELVGMISQADVAQAVSARDSGIMLDQISSS
ncbi:MAG: CBS domain-containing protein [Candidatus Eremiobacteraeota bacterium]|nr:CBS domain-containing protein [Candidatus Eremiobacteraeota bacterium]MBV8423779.1 CBS domain-containing protein [Candidatus Eremiobacteraeota bacterium]MBV8721789.1 CBS domain-containing protein [Candidatus Eremiobacteraeota bacterium]